LEISNPRAVLEHALRNFSCVTKGDIIQLPYNNKNFQFELKEVKPEDAACIIETDCNVDFDAPVGYQEPNYRAASPSASSTGAASSVADAASSIASSAQQKANGMNGVASASLNGDTTQSTKSDSKKKQEEESAVRIVDGNVVVNENYDNMLLKKKTKLLADRTGGTGLQKNAAVPDVAPEIDYWACNAGHGARLDGKKPAQLKDKNGNIVDEQRIRDRRNAALEAAQRRSAAAAAAASSSKAASATATAPTQPVSKRKTKVGKKYSRLKQTGLPFNGNANKF